jgi:hypothetical protein
MSSEPGSFILKSSQELPVQQPRSKHLQNRFKPAKKKYEAWGVNMPRSKEKVIVTPIFEKN